MSRLPRLDFGLCGLDRSVPVGVLQQLFGSPEEDQKIGLTLLPAYQLAYQGYPWEPTGKYREGSEVQARRYEGLTYPAWYEIEDFQRALPKSTFFSFHLNETEQCRYVSNLLQNNENEHRLVLDLIVRYSARHIQINLSADGVPSELFTPQGGDETSMQGPLDVVLRLCETYKDTVFIVPFTQRETRDGKMVDTSIFIDRLLAREPFPRNLCVLFDSSAGTGTEPDKAPDLPSAYPKDCNQFVGFTGGIDATNAHKWLDRYAARAQEFGCALLSDAQSGFRQERSRGKPIDAVALTDLVSTVRQWASEVHQRNAITLAGPVPPLPAGPVQLNGSNGYCSSAFGATSSSSAIALRISGYAGRFKAMNGVFEPMEIQHHGRTCWVLRGPRPVYIYHTGKTRWVISKHIDQGSHCYAYVEDEHVGDPSCCSRTQWAACGEDNQWRPDLALKCEAVPATVDKFVCLRQKLESELREYGLLDASCLRQLWRRVDVAGVGLVAVLELERLCGDMVLTGLWPEWMRNPQAFQQAVEHTPVVNVPAWSVRQQVERDEFHTFLLNFYWFCKMQFIFEGIGVDGECQLTLGEFVAGVARLGLKLTQSEATEVFQKMDCTQPEDETTSLTGLSAFLRRRVHPDVNNNFESEIHPSANVSEALRRKSGSKGTHGYFMAKKCMRDFDELKECLAATMSDQRVVRKLWDRVDFNGAGVALLLEVERLVSEMYPLLNHKPAILSAHRSFVGHATLGEPRVQRKDFTSLLDRILVFNKLFWLFDVCEVDSEPRLNYGRFRWCTGLSIPGSNAEASQTLFQSLDRAKSGFVSFDGFCLYVLDSRSRNAD